MIAIVLKLGMCLTAILSLSVSLTTAYLWIFQEPFLTYVGPQPFHLLSPTVVAGQPILFEINRCSSAKETRSYTISRRMVSLTPGVKDIDLPPIQWFIDPGCDASPSITYAHIAPAKRLGRFYLKGWSEASGTVRQLIVTWQTEPFDVVEP